MCSGGLKPHIYVETQVHVGSGMAIKDPSGRMKRFQNTIEPEPCPLAREIG